MKPLISIFLSFIISLSMLTGCDFKDIDKRLFIVALGLDSDPANPKDIKVTFKAALPSQGGSTGSDQTTTATADNLTDIFRIIKTKTGNEPDFSHMKIIIFGKGFAANKSLNDAITFFTRRRDFQMISWIAVGAPSASAILSFNPKEEMSPGSNLFMKFGEGAESQYARKQRLFEMYHQLQTPGISPSCAIIELKEDTYVMENMAVFDENGKTKLVLGRDETKLFNILDRGIKLGSLVLRDGDSPIGIGLEQAKGSIKLAKPYTKPVFNIDVKARAGLEETVAADGNTEELSKKFSKLLTKQMGNLLNKLKENEVDPLEFESTYWAKNREVKFSKSWLKEEYQHAVFNVNCDVKIERTGYIK